MPNARATGDLRVAVRRVPGAGFGADVGGNSIVSIWAWRQRLTHPRPLATGAGRSSLAEAVAAVVVAQAVPVDVARQPAPRERTDAAGWVAQWVADIRAASGVGYGFTGVAVVRAGDAVDEATAAGVRVSRLKHRAGRNAGAVALLRVTLTNARSARASSTRGRGTGRTVVSGFALACLAPLLAAFVPSASTPVAGLARTAVSLAFGRFGGVSRVGCRQTEAAKRPDEQAIERPPTRCGGQGFGDGVEAQGVHGNVVRVEFGQRDPGRWRRPEPWSNQTSHRYRMPVLASCQARFALSSRLAQ